MPIANIQITQAKQIKNNITFTAQQGNNVITREVDVSEFSTWQQFAQWIINQSPDFVLLPDKLKSLSITFHTETDPETGATTRIVDSVIVT